jgi:hypothetical protein
MKDRVSGMSPSVPQHIRSLVVGDTLPSTRATDNAGSKWTRGPDGQWFRDYSAVVLQPRT